MALPASFVLAPEEVDRLREVAGQRRAERHGDRLSLANAVSRTRPRSRRRESAGRGSERAGVAGRGVPCGWRRRERSDLSPDAHRAIEHAAGYGVFSTFGIKIFLGDGTTGSGA
jgi:hypothetical protein